MNTDFSQTEFRYVSKNSRYLDPKRKALAKRTFFEEQTTTEKNDFIVKLRAKCRQVVQFFKRILF